LKHPFFVYFSLALNPIFTNERITAAIIAVTKLPKENPRTSTAASQIANASMTIETIPTINELLDLFLLNIFLTARTIIALIKPNTTATITILNKPSNLIFINGRNDNPHKTNALTSQLRIVFLFPFIKRIPPSLI